MLSSPPPSVIENVRGYGLALEGALLAGLRAYLAHLLETNRSFNLTAVTEPDVAWTKHIEDSLSLAPWLRSAAEGPVIDVGSGGGLPAIPLAFAFPERSFTLLEATGKKADFLRDSAQRFGLSNVTVVAERAETAGQGPLRERFSVCTSRALSRMPVLLELTLPLLRVGGVALAIKGEQAAVELDEARRALSLLGGELLGFHATPTGTVVRVAKQKPTPARYPRRPGEPKRAPLV